MLSTLPNVSLADHKTEDRESKSLWPKELQQRDIKRDELLISYHNLATIVNKCELVYNYTSLLS
jgi:hypothetical protein